MLFFMFLSGAVASYAHDLTFFHHLRRKALTLLLPFSAWYFMKYVVLTARRQEPSGRDYVEAVLRNPDNGLWFLCVLFVALGALAACILQHQWIGPVAYVIALLMVERLPVSSRGGYLFRVHFVYFLCGYLFQRHRMQLPHGLGKCALACFPVLALTWRRTMPPTFSPQLSHLLSKAYLAAGFPIALRLYDVVLAFVRRCCLRGGASARQGETCHERPVRAGHMHARHLRHPHVLPADASVRLGLAHRSGPIWTRH